MTSDVVMTSYVTSHDKINAIFGSSGLFTYSLIYFMAIFEFP